MVGMLDLNMNTNLTKESIESIETILNNYATEDSVILSMNALDGYITGLLSVLPLVNPSHWLPYIFGGKMPTLQSQDEIMNFISFVVSHFNKRSRTLKDRPKEFMPMMTKVMSDGTTFIDAAEWATAYRYAWNCFDDDSDQPPAFIENGLNLIYEYANDIDKEEWLNSLPKEEQQREVKKLCDAITMIHSYNLTRRREMLSKNPYCFQTSISAMPMAAPAFGPSATGPMTQTRSTPKVGRNDPCPCGSGKKYKKCCMLKN